MASLVTRLSTLAAIYRNLSVNESLSGSLPSGLGGLPLTRLSLRDNTGLSGALPSGFANMDSLQRLAIANTSICAPDTEAFSDWLDTVPDKAGRSPDLPVGYRARNLEEPVG